MKQLNTLAIEDFLDKARIAIKTNQKTLTMPIGEVVALQNSLAVVMSRLSGELDKVLNTTVTQSAVEIKMDGGKF